MNVPDYLWRRVTVDAQYGHELKVGDRVKMKADGFQQTMQVVGWTASQTHPGAIDVQLVILLPTSVTVRYLDPARKHAESEVTEASPRHADAQPHHITIERLDLTTEKMARRVACLALDRPDWFSEKDPA